MAEIPDLDLAVTADFIINRANDAYFSEIASLVFKQGSVYFWNLNDILAKQSTFDGDVQKRHLANLSVRILYQSRYSVLAPHQRKPR